MFAILRDRDEQLSAITFLFWAVSIFRFSFALLFFRDHPAVATGVGSAISVAFAYVLLVWRLRGPVRVSGFRWSRTATWIVIYLAWCAASLSWSYAGSLLSATGYLATMVVDLLIVAATLKWGSVETVGLASLKGIIAGDCLISLVALTLALNDEAGRLGDVDFLHPGNVGNFAAIGALCSFFFWLRSRTESCRSKWYWAGTTVFLAWVLMRSLSKTPLVGFSAAFIVYLWVSKNITLKAKFRVAVVAASLCICMYSVVSTYIANYVEETDVTTLTGRTALWMKTWEMIRDRPITGYGFLSFRDHGPQDWEQRTVHGHNEWLTQWFQLGLVGLLCTIAIYVSYFRCLGGAPPSRMRELGLCLLVYMLIEGSAIAEPHGLMFPLTMMLLLTMWVRQPIVSANQRPIFRSTAPLGACGLRESPSWKAENLISHSNSLL